MILIALVAGTLGLILSLALRRDTPRARSLRASGGVIDERFAFLLIPGFSLVLLCAGLLGLVAPGMGSALGVFGYLLGAILGAGILAGLYMSVIGLGSGPAPEWAQPKWARRK